MKIDEVKTFLNSEFPIAIYDDQSDTDKFTVGFLVATTDQYALINSISTRGYEDGFYLTLVEDIYRIDMRSQYLTKIMLLWQNLRQEKTLAFTSKDNLVTDLLKYAQKESLMVSLFLFNEETTGITVWLKELKESSITLELVDDYGRPDGISIIDSSNIARIYCDSGHERNMKYLFDTGGVTTE